jgi:transposase
MYDDTIHILQLSHLKDKIEHLDIRVESNQLIAEIRLKQITDVCPRCASSSVSFHEYKYHKIIHSISTGQSCILHYHHRRYRCQTCGKTFGEYNPFVQKYSNIGHYTRLSVLDYLKDFNHTFTDTANLYHISIQSAIDIFDQAVDAKRRVLPEVICIDEVFTNKMNRYKYACILLDFKASKIIDVISTRHKNYLIEYFSRIPKAEKDQVKVFVMDMWESYREAIKLTFPNTLISIDSFHIIRTLNDVVKVIRIRTQNKYRLNKSSPEHDDMYYYMLKKFHYFLVKNYENIFDGKIRIAKYNTYWHKSEILDYLLSIDEDLKSAYRLKERYREFNLTAEYETCDDELDSLIYEFRNHKLLELRTFGKTIEHWRIEIKNSFLVFNKRRVSNGPIESTNSKIKTIIKTANGIRKFTRFRNRVMYSINKDIPIKNK